MMNISIFSNNNSFAEDLKTQINLHLPDIEVDINAIYERTGLLLVDEEENLIKSATEKYKDIPVVLFSTIKDISALADLVIKKPFRLNKFLDSLKSNTLIPKVRRKECINIKEYKLFPVKKEIASTITNNSLKLTEKEIDIIKYLYQIAPKTATKEEMLENVWEYSAEATTHTVETHIYRLRQKVEKDGGSQLIITENNGYRLNI